MTQGVSTGDPTDSQRNLKDEESGTGAKDLDPSEKLLYALDKKDALKVWELVKNKGGLINSLKNFYPDIADWERNSLKSIRCEFTCGCTTGQLLPENPEAVWKKDKERRRWIKILSNPLFIGVEWFLRTEANKGETKADKGENEDVIKCALEDAHLLEKVASLEQNKERDEQNKERDEQNKERDDCKSLVKAYETFVTNVINESTWDEFYKIMNVEGDNSVLDERPEGVTKLKGCLSLLKIAAKMRRKTFVTAPICQFIVDQITFEGWRDWKRKSCQEKVFRWFVHFLGALILAPIYIPLRLLGKVCPSKSNGECFFRSSCRGKCFCCLYEFPFSKFVNHAMSYIILLCLLFSSTLGNEIQYYSETGLHRLDYAVLIFVIGLSLRDFIGACNQGASFYFSKWWNVMHVVTTSTFLVSYSVWLIAWEIDGEWDPQKEIFTVADVLYATATVMAFFHFTYVFQTSSTLGPLQLSLFKMVKDVLRFLFIFFILFLAFAAGVVKVYAYYVSSQIKLSREPGNSTYEKDHPYAKLVVFLYGRITKGIIQQPMR